MRSVIAVALLLFAGVTTATAQTGPTFFVHSGATLPTGEGADATNTGFNLGAAVDLGFAPGLAIQPAISYHRLGLDDESVLSALDIGGSGASVSGGTNSLLTAMANIKYTIPTAGSTQPYLLAGAGMTRLGMSDLTVTVPGASLRIEAESVTKFGVNFGAGLDVAVAPTVGIFGQLTYAIAFTEDRTTRMIPLHLGVSFRPGL